MHIFAASGLAFSILYAASPALAQPPEAKRNPSGISMQSVLHLNQSGAGPKVIGGREAKTADWPASLFAEFTDTDGAKWSCTATLIGPTALLFAAHCVGNGQEVKVDVLGTEVTGECAHAPEWKDGTGDPSADYALCKLKKPIADVVYETLNDDPSRLKAGEPIVLTGYGCIQPPPPGVTQGTGADGKYRIGEAKVVALPGDPGNEPNTILTRDKTMVCQGDSGGGSYLVLTANKRLLVGVNSRVWFIKDESYISSVTAANGVDFIKKWIAANSEKVCGINLSGSSCK